MKRGGPLKRTGYLRRKKWMRRRARTTEAERAARWELVYGDQARLAWRLPCAACGRWPTADRHTQAAHVVTRKAGGLAADVCPLCAACHLEQGTVGILTFQASRGVDMAREASRLADALLSHECDAWPLRDGACAVCSVHIDPEALAT